MNCENPYYSKKYMCMFPCRDCLPCRIRRARDWACRIILEMSQHSHNTFLTLTYDDDHLPLNASLVPDDLKNLWKRVRKAGLRLRYFACGEYGSESFRPHYHAILFGVNYRISEVFFKKFWKDDDKQPLGFIYSVPATLETASYVAGYVTKKLEKNSVLAECGMYPEFIRSSRRPAVGLGALEQLVRISLENLSYFDKNIDVFGQIQIGGKKYALPKFLRDKLRECVYDTEYIAKLKEARVLSMQDQINELVFKHFGIRNGCEFKSFSLEANKNEMKPKFESIYSRQKIFNQRSKI